MWKRLSHKFRICRVDVGHLTSTLTTSKCSAQQRMGSYNYNITKPTNLWKKRYITGEKGQQVMFTFLKPKYSIGTPTWRQQLRVKHAAKIIQAPYSDTSIHIAPIYKSTAWKHHNTNQISTTEVFLIFSLHSWYQWGRQNIRHISLWNTTQINTANYSL